MYFFFNDTAATEIYTLSLHDALPISRPQGPYALVTLLVGVNNQYRGRGVDEYRAEFRALLERAVDRKSTRLNSSHANISYAVFCFKKKNTTSAAHVLHHCQRAPMALT